MINYDVGAYWLKVTSELQIGYSDVKNKTKYVGKEKDEEGIDKEVKKIINEELKPLMEDVDDVVVKINKLKQEIRRMKFAEEIEYRQEAIKSYLEERKINEWYTPKDDRFRADERHRIQNPCFYFDIRRTGKRTTYRFGLNYLEKVIKNIQKDHASVEDAKKYMEGRKKYYSKYFKEELPVLPEKIEPKYGPYNEIDVEEECRVHGVLPADFKFKEGWVLK